MAVIIGAPTLDEALAALARRIGEREARGERNIIFCEDRLTLLAERAVLAAEGGTFLTEVTTFSRYLSGRRVLSKAGSVMEISSIIGESELRCFRPRAAQAVYETIAQLSASRVTPEMLRGSAESSEGILKDKLLDLADIFESYSRRLAERGLLDENAYLSLLPEKIGRELGDANVFFFGFRSFTRQAAEGIAAALGAARSVTGIFLAGRAEIYTNESARVFRRVCDEIAAEPEIVLIKDGEEGEPRILREGLFCPERLSLPPAETGRVRRFEAGDETEELSVVAALIKKYVFGGMRYRDIAVLVDGEENFLTVEKVFSSYRIPFFADKKRAFSAHPFCSFALSVLSAVSDGVLPDEADAIASSLYFGQGEEYRNYLLKFGGYRGAVRREIRGEEDLKGYDREKLLLARERMLACLACFPRKGRGGDFTDGVRALYGLTDAENVTEELKASFTGAERDFLATDKLFSVLGEIDSLAREHIFTAREFYDVFQNGLSTLSVSVLPQYADAVFVGDLTESKFGRVKVLFATGLTDSVPRTSQDTAVISDGEIGKLSELKVEIEPAIAQVNARARESLALNLCAFEEALYLSYPLRSDGEEREKSEIFRYVEGLFRLPPMPALFPYDCSEPQPAALRMLALKQGFEAGREREVGEYSAIYALLKEEGEDPDRLILGGRKEAVPKAGELVFAGPVSPTLLESYFSCPYAGFVTRALRLREREERPVLDTDAGTFVHAVLERTAKEFNAFSGEDDCRAFAAETARALLGARYSALSDTAAGVYAARRLVEEAAQVTVMAYRQLAQSAFRVKETEGAVELPSLFLAGKTDRIDVSDEFVRVIDYKTGKIDDTPTAYYTGRKLQLELYLRAAAGEGRAAGAFYFPAADDFTDDELGKFRLSGFYCGEDDVISRMDPALPEGEKSLFFEGKRDGKFTDKGMSRENFEAFLDYSLLVSARAENEIRAGNISPSPYENECRWCKLRALCGFVGTPRKERAIRCAQIAEIVRRERGDK